MTPFETFDRILPLLPPGSTVILHSACGEPRHLARELAAHAHALRDVRLITLMPMGETPYAAPAMQGHLEIATFHPGKGLRAAATEGRVEVLRTSLGNIPKLFEDRAIRPDVLLLQLSPPDENGAMSLGLAVDYMRAALARGPTVVAEINPLCPRTRGDTLIRQDQVAFFTDSRDPPVSVAAAKPDAVDERIADHVAELIPNGAVVQAGIGSLPDLVLGRLIMLHDLSIHTGIITDALLPLLARGVVTNARKRHFAGRCVTTMAAGTQAFYDALHDNPEIEFHPSSVTHDVKLLAELDGLCAINSVLEIDLGGRANAERVDGRIISAPGGLPDFARGASRARNGKSIIALRATSQGGRRSSIVAALASDAPMTIGPDDIDYVVTEYGVARVGGLAAANRARQLIAVAHPDFRAELSRRAAPL